jgi:signal transduction histidine kinase
MKTLGWRTKPPKSTAKNPGPRDVPYIGRRVWRLEATRVSAEEQDMRGKGAHIAVWSSAAMVAIVAGVATLALPSVTAGSVPWHPQLPAELLFATAGAASAIAAALAITGSSSGSTALLPADASITLPQPDEGEPDPAMTLPVDPAAPSVEEISAAMHSLLGEFEAARDTQRRLIRGIGHDLRSPLASIISMCESLSYGELGQLSAEQAEACNLMAETARRLMAQSELLYALAEGREDIGARRRERFDAREVVRPLVEGVRIWASAKGVDLVLHVTEFPLLILSDRGAFERIAANLIDNAVKFTDHGFVRVTLGSAVDVMRLVVEDSGIGIASDDIDRVMTEYFRSAAASDRAGSGVGLAVCRDFAESLGGSLTVASEIGRGSRFELTLPVISPSGWEPTLRQPGENICDV